MKKDSLKVSVDQARLVQVSLPTTSIIVSKKIKIFPFLGTSMTMDQAKLCAQVQTCPEVCIDLVKLPRGKLHALEIFISVKLQRREVYAQQ